MSYGYARFIQTVGTPGAAGTDIAKARVRTNKDQTIARDEEMLSIDIGVVDGAPVLILRASRLIEKKFVIVERHTPLSNVRDLEPLPEVLDPKLQAKKGNAQ